MCSLPKEKLVEMFHWLLKLRRMEEKAIELALAGLVPGWLHSYLGQEAISVGVVSNLRKEDYIAGNHRSRGHDLVKGVDLKRVLEAYLGRAGENTEEIRRLQESLARIQRDGLTHFQRVGLVRFNPFEDTGGDQSFALALLDNHGSGIVISSLYQRETTRIYGKPVKEGKEEGYEFSDEEEEAIKRAREQ